MAELTVGLSRSVVVGAITKVQSAFDGARLRQSAKDDLVCITMELQKMESFLDKEWADKNLAMTWAKHTRQLAYDVEDCVHDVVHLSDKSAVTSWHRRRLLPSCLAATVPLDRAIQELGELKGRLQDVNDTYKRHNAAVDDSAAPAAAAEPRQGGVIDMLRDDSRWQRGMGNLTQLITYDGETALRVISIWGTRGHHGTTSIIADAYNDDQICKDFTHRAWVKLTHPFSPTEFVPSLMAQLYETTALKEQTGNMTVGMCVLAKMKAIEQDLSKEFDRLVTENKYLLVLEGLSDMADWNAIMNFLPDMRNGSRIVVSTHSSEIASLCVGKSYKMHELKRFSADHSVYALFDMIPMWKQHTSLQAQANDDKGKKPEGIYVATQTSSHDKTASTAEKWMKNTVLVGLGPQMKKLHEDLAKAYVNRPSVLSLWGLAGVGKSTLVKNIYYSEVLNGINFKKYYWVDLSHPLNLRDFYLSLPPDFHPEDDRCLIVFDDVRSKEDWNLIQHVLFNKNSKSVIMVITPEASIAKYCTNNEGLVYNVKALETTASFDLVKMKVYKKTHLSQLTDKKDVKLEELTLKCGGFPRVIVGVSNLLARNTDKLMDNVSSFNRGFMHHLESNPEFRSMEGLFGCISSILLNPPAFLKPCIFYLSIFPQGHIIRRRRLVRRWVAEGYTRESMGRNAEEIAEKYYSELLELSIFQQVPQLVDSGALDDTRMVFYQVNAFIREYILSRRMQENLVFELGGSCPLTTQSKGRHLVILSNWERDRVVFKNLDLSRLTSLTVFGKWEPFLVSESMTLLQVLDLEDAWGVRDEDLENIVRLMQRLKFLSLRGCREIYHLPNSVGDLRQLQTLDVMDTSILNLPTNITKLQKLQYVRAGTTIPIATGSASRFHKLCRKRNQHVGVVVPAGIGKMTMLHTLGVVNIAASGGMAIMKELKELTQVRKLGVSGINKHNSKEFLSLISGHGHLESLSMRLDKNNQRCFDEMSQLPWDKLHSLKLYGLGDKLPLLRNKHAKLRKLDLEMNSLMQTDIQFLAELENLCILRLGVKQASLHLYAELNGKQIKSYEKVKILEIACSNSSLHVTFGSQAMINLEVLNLDCSSGSSSYLLSGLNYQSELKEVLLKGTNDKALKTALQSQLLKHPKKPVVKLWEQTCSS